MGTVSLMRAAIRSRMRRSSVEAERRLRPMADGLSERTLRSASTLLRRIRERIAARMNDTVPTRG